MAGSGSEKADPELCSITNVFVLLACSNFHCYLLFSSH